MKRLVSAENGEENDYTPDDQPPFHYPIDYVLMTWLDHKYHHSYPEPGGYNDQCPFLMQDWNTLTMYHIRVDKGVFTEIDIPVDENASSWLDMAKD